MINVLPPRTLDRNIVQLGEPHSHTYFALHIQPYIELMVLLGATWTIVLPGSSTMSLTRILNYIKSLEKSMENDDLLNMKIYPNEWSIQNAFHDCSEKIKAGKVKINSFCDQLNLF